MRRVDASRADIRGASLAGVAGHGLSLRRAIAWYARMAGMWGGPFAETKPEVKPLEDGTMPNVTPISETDGNAQRWAKEPAKRVDAAKEAEEDAQDEAAVQEWKKQRGIDTSKILNMQQMNAK